MPERSYWFTKWLIAFGLFLPFWGFMSLDGYRSDQSFLWNAANYPITVSFLPKENVLSCWSYELGDIINSSFGFTPDRPPPGCAVRAKWSYLNILGFSAFLLLMGLYCFMRPPQVDEYKLVDDDEDKPKTKARRPRPPVLEDEAAPAPDSTDDMTRYQG